ncbi:hypothetical protein ACF8GG_05700, partial [Pseudomonas sp. yb_1]
GFSASLSRPFPTDEQLVRSFLRAIAEEFYPIEENQAPAVLPQRTSKISLAEKLDVQAEAQ